MLFQIRSIQEIDKSSPNEIGWKDQVYHAMNFMVEYSDGSSKIWQLGFDPADTWTVLMSNLNYQVLCEPKPISIEKIYDSRLEELE